MGEAAEKIPTSGERSCFICGGTLTGAPVHEYLRCTECGHEIAVTEDLGAEIVNDQLSMDEIRSYGPLDRFKDRVLDTVALSHRVLLDIGSASGKFLTLNRNKFAEHLGIEVTPSCVEFSRTALGLTIATSFEGSKTPLSVVTMWHALEHIPIAVIPGLLSAIRKSSDTDTRVVISVPNAASFQYRWFGDSYPYCDKASHQHQFTPASLDLLMGSFGFVRERRFYSFPYSSFGYLQGLMNRCQKIHNYFYYRKKRGWDYGLSPTALQRKDLFNMLLAGFFLPVAVMLSLLDAVWKEKGAVITASYKAGNQ